MSIWHSTEAVCLILGLICIFYYIGIVGYGRDICQTLRGLAGGRLAFLLAIAGGMVAESRHHMAVLANLLRAAGILIAIGILVVGFIGAHIFAGMRAEAGAEPSICDRARRAGAGDEGVESTPEAAGLCGRVCERKSGYGYFFCRAVRETARISQRQKRCRSI